MAVILPAPGEARNVTGIVFNIQHYCIHDGPGIRTNVFVKGCPLRCIWCANPESQRVQPELLYRKDKCTGCGRCAVVCPVHAITLNEGRTATNRALCKSCGRCAKACPHEARTIAGERNTAGAVADEVLEEKLFYGTEGGVTVTGGEAFAQPEFTGAVLQLCREGGVTTAVETCGQFSWEHVAPVFRSVDFVLFDMKEMDAEKHRAFTGVTNERILENLEHISRETACEIFIRCPVIPGCNDTESNYRALSAFLQERGIRFREIDLLPYHNLDVGKREELETAEEGFETVTPPPEKLESLRQILLERDPGWIVTY